MSQRRYFSLWNRTVVPISRCISGTAPRKNWNDRPRPQDNIGTLSNTRFRRPKSFSAATSLAETTTRPATTLNIDSLSHPDCNITHDIAQRVGKNLHLRPQHPINIIKERIESYWKNRIREIEIFDNLHPLVSTQANFDSLLIAKDHVSRRKSDTYYYNDATVLRTHTSAHQSELLSKGLSSFLVTGDVYRRDEIDSCHYPVFHQMEGVKLLTELHDNSMTFEERVKVVEYDLKEGLEGLTRELFGDVVRDSFHYPLLVYMCPFFSYSCVFLLDRRSDILYPLLFS